MILQFPKYTATFIQNGRCREGHTCGISSFKLQLVFVNTVFLSHVCSIANCNFLVNEKALQLDCLCNLDAFSYFLFC